VGLAIVTEYIEMLDSIYGSMDLLSVIWEKLHEYLGIIIDFSLKRGIAMSEYNFIKKIWLALPDELKRCYQNIPAPDYLFKIDPNAILVNKIKKE